MPHFRPRHLHAVFTKSLGFWPVVCLVGSRQVGKSTFLRAFKQFRYQTFDDSSLADLAARNPREILHPPCVIGEAQKVPGVFDAVKLEVDLERRPGSFVLTGSVRFSRRTLIRESLTGRAKTLQMFPLTCAETLGLSFEDRFLSRPKVPRVARRDHRRYLARGGMPANFAARSASESASYWNALIESYVYRDLLMAVPKNPKPALAMSLLKAIAEILALGELPTFARLTRKAGGTRLMIERHLAGLEDMMILHRVGHQDASRTKDILLPFDPSLFLALLRLDSPAHDASVHLACLHIALLNEALAQAQYAGRPLEARYAVSARGEVIHLITQSPKGPVFWKFCEEAVPHAYQTRFLRAQALKHGGSAKILSSSERSFKEGGIEVLPWESVL